MRLKTILAVSLLTLAVSCAHETASPIVAIAEAHGAGDLQTVDVRSMRQWIRTHPSTGKRILSACRALPTTDAGWRERTEGRLCEAASIQHFYGLEGEDQ